MYFAAFGDCSKVAFTMALIYLYFGQMIGWIIRGSKGIYYYEGCTFTMQGENLCPENQISRCNLPNYEDCINAKQIVKLITVALAFPLVMIAFQVLYTAVYHYYKWTQCIVLRCQQFMWFSCFLISAILSFIAANKITSFQEAPGTPIVLGLCYIFIVMCIIIINIELHDYLKTVVSQPRPTQTSITVLQDITRVDLIFQPVTKNQQQVQITITRR